MISEPRSLVGRQLGSYEVLSLGRIVFASQIKGVDHIFEVKAQGGKPRRLTTGAKAERSPTSSPDGKWIYFSSGSGETEEIWKVAAAGGPSVQVTRNGGTTPRFSPDGRSLYYNKKSQQESGSLWRSPAEGGKEEKIVDGVYANSFALGTRGIYFISCKRWPSGGAVEFLPYGTSKVTLMANLTRPPSSGLSVSPRDTRLLFAQFDNLGWDLMMIDHFR